MSRRFAGILAFVSLTLSSISGQTSPSPGATTPTPNSLRILAPKNGDKISQNFVEFNYELATPASASGSPTFQVRLDSAEPVRTTDSRYTFTGLQPGRHTLSVEVVDANNIPVQGSRAEVHFSIAAPATPQPTPPPPRRPESAQLISAAANASADAHMENATFQQAPASTQQDEGSSTLPQSSSSLPLLSVIGLGGLVGGIVSALRTRRR